MSDDQGNPETLEEARLMAYDASCQSVMDTILAEQQNKSTLREQAEAIMTTLGWARDEERIMFWDPFAIVVLKSDLVIALKGSECTVMRNDPNEVGSGERPGHSVDITWGDKGKEPKWIKRLQISGIDPPEGRGA